MGIFRRKMPSHYIPIHPDNISKKDWIILLEAGTIVGSTEKLRVAKATLERKIVRKYNIFLRAKYFLVLEGYDPRIHALYFCPQLYKFGSDNNLVALDGVEIGELLAQQLQNGVVAKKPWKGTGRLRQILPGSSRGCERRRRGLRMEERQWLKMAKAAQHQQVIEPGCTRASLSNRIRRCRCELNSVAIECVSGVAISNIWNGRLLARIFDCHGNYARNIGGMIEFLPGVINAAMALSHVFLPRTCRYVNGIETPVPQRAGVSFEPFGNHI